MLSWVLVGTSGRFGKRPQRLSNARDCILHRRVLTQVCPGEAQMILMMKAVVRHAVCLDGIDEFAVSHRGDPD